MITNIGDKIRYLRDKSGFTQSYLAKRLGISRSAVNSWEMSLSSPSLSNIIEMMDIFHVTADYLLGTSEKMMVDVSKLSSEEQEVIIKLVNCLNNPSKQL
ncbi:MAG: helix-turn-helix transcriptional regulator [Clostridia bacterium]|nr:helix-turn-helix transcriptional regulator [Clostridia bacterium]MBP3583297.1 helix-turn-helix transcriptional regulator [Clostridia bacterium]